MLANKFTVVTRSGHKPEPKAAAATAAAATSAPMVLTPRKVSQLEALFDRVQTLEIAHQDLQAQFAEQRLVNQELRELVKNLSALVQQGFAEVRTDIGQLATKAVSPPPPTPPAAPAGPALSYSNDVSAHAMPMPGRAPAPPPTTHANMKTMRLTTNKPLPPMAMEAINHAPRLLMHMGFDKEQINLMTITTQRKHGSTEAERVTLAILVSMPAEWAYVMPRDVTYEEATWRIRPHLPSEEFKNRQALWAANLERLQAEVGAGKRLSYNRKYTQVCLEDGSTLSLPPVEST